MKNNIFIISGPSGAGEDSIIDGLARQLPIERVITTTTRSMRAGEVYGNPYYFISQEEFKKGIEDGDFFEYAQEYNDCYYGVTRQEIKRVQESAKDGKIGIWKIEYKGVISAKKLIPNIKSIFINAPLDVLEERIRKRGGVSDQFIEERLAYTKEWLKHLDIYDYQVENVQGKLEQSIAKVALIIQKELNIDKN